MIDTEKSCPMGPQHILTLLVITCCLLVSGVGPALAHTSDDGRPATAAGELNALYRHALNRTPDPDGQSAYLSLADKDCRVGVLRFSYDILTSAEAARYLWSADRQTNAVYMTLLNRAPDPDGWKTYLAMNRSEGIDRSTVDIMKSQEYRNRLAAICQGRNSSLVGVYNRDEAAQIVDNLLRGAALGSVTCGINTLVKKLRKFKGKPSLGAIAAYSADLSEKISNTKGACKLVGQSALAATRIAYIASLDHPVYVNEVRTTSTGWISKKTTYTWHVGWTPSDTLTFGPGSVKGLRW
jgi:hypothetical protein